MRLLGLAQPGQEKTMPGKAKFLRYEKLTGEEKDATFMKW